MNVIETAPPTGAARETPFDARLRGLLETAWPGVSDSIARAESIGVRWRALSTAHFAPNGSPPVAHAGVLDLPWVVNGTPRKVGGIHAVCTHPLFQGRGFMRAVMGSALAQCDAEFETVALFTIEPALYRRFGFRVVPQVVYELVERLPPPGSIECCRNLCADSPEDVEFLRRALAEREIVSKRLAISNRGGDLFLLNEVMETGGFQRIFHLAALDAIVAAEPLGETLVIHDIVAKSLPPLLDVVAALPFPRERVELHFSPDRMAGLRFAPLPLVTHEYLMVRGPLGLDEGELIVPQHVRC